MDGNKTKGGYALMALALAQTMAAQALPPDATVEISDQPVQAQTAQKQAMDYLERLFEERNEEKIKAFTLLAQSDPASQETMEALSPLMKSHPSALARASFQKLVVPQIKSSSARAEAIRWGLLDPTSIEVSKEAVKNLHTLKRADLESLLTNILVNDSLMGLMYGGSSMPAFAESMREYMAHSVLPNVSRDVRSHVTDLMSEDARATFEVEQAIKHGKMSKEDQRKAIGAMNDVLEYFKDDPETS